ncbi:AbrB family transcriptional regulator [Paracoccus contaminans]|uniref:Ammonia monooxygenase n=1 Tax=Paracoccus contaminans TaxID=1945662 RepID=A0A1W6D1I0_9RHOB|nr:AbrB family transcriptional regulator [Paracoccus contaminans]ARJ70978.1 hypothetical protein B0A89_14190 [Paracoccus contaminans]
MADGPALLRALCIGLAGAGLASEAGLPAAPLIGSSVAVSAAAWAGLRLRMDPRLRNLGFLGIGLSLGSGIDPAALAQLGHWAVSLAGLVLSLAVTMGAGAWILRRHFGCDRGTAVLASSPGTMSYALAVAEDGGGDPVSVLTIQSLRLLVLASVLPVAVWLFVGEVPALARSAADPLPLAVLAALGGGLGWLLARRRVPAAWLLGGFGVSALAHGTGLAGGVLPWWVSFLCFGITGTTIGTRFSGLDARALTRNLGAAVVVAAIASALSLVCAAVVARLTGLPLGQVWVAYAPGGVEAMAAIGLSLGYDPAYVALHHLVRIAVLVVMVPLFLRRTRS